MSDLKKLFIEASFSDVVTYINSGNVIFRAQTATAARMRAGIEKRLKERFGFEVKVIVTTLKELNGFLSACPYDQEKLGQDEAIYISLLSAAPAKRRVDIISSYPGGLDEFRIAGKAVYLIAKHGYSKTRYNNAYMEKGLNVDATTRNINTLMKIAEIGLQLG